MLEILIGVEIIFFPFESGCAAGARTMEMRTSNSWCMITELVYDYGDELCAKEVSGTELLRWLQLTILW
jgi:hypothetical protein